MFTLGTLVVVVVISTVTQPAWCLPPCDNVVDIKYFGCLQHGVDTEVGQYSLPRVTAIIQELECRHDIQISPFSHSVMLDLCGRTEFSSRISVCTDFSFHFC